MSQIKPESYKIPSQKDTFFLAEDLKIFNPEFFIGTSKGVRKIIERKNIPNEEIIYANMVKNDWKVCDASSKKAKLFISKTWADKYFFARNIKKSAETKPETTETTETKPETTETKPETTETTEEVVEEAPQLLFLEEEEKFKDIDGNIIEIETIGERQRNKIFFKVKDIMEGFGMPSLNIVLLNKDKGYERNRDYKNFIRKKNSVKKTLYLTFDGLLRVIFNSRKKHKNHYVMKKWIDQFDKKSLNSYTINIPSRNNDMIGYVYIATSDILDAAKIGFWRSSKESLRSRYITSYGENVNIFYFYTNDAYFLEQKTHNFFENYRITNELFDKRYITEYIDFLEMNKETPQITNLNDSFENIKIIDKSFEDKSFKIITEFSPYDYSIDIENYPFLINFYTDVDINISSDGLILYNYDDIISFFECEDYDLQFNDGYILKNENIKNTLYLSSKGLLRVLFVCQNKNAEIFQDFFEEKIFKNQFCKNDKNEEVLSCMKYQYETQIQELKHTIAMKDKDIELKNKDIELLELKLLVSKMGK